MKRLFKILRNLIIVLLLLAAALYVAIQQPVVQTWVAQRAAAYLSSQLGAKVTLSRIEVDLWARLVIDDLYVEDRQKDTLLFIPKLHLRNYRFNAQNGDILLNGGKLYSPYFNLHKHAGDSLFNYKFILDYVASLSNPQDTSHTQLRFSNIEIENGRFVFEDSNKPLRDVYGMDWTHMAYSNINLQLNALTQIRDSIHADIEHLSAKEKCGLDVTNMSGKFINTSSRMYLEDACIQTNQTDINGTFKCDYETIDDLDFFEEKVRINARFQPSNVQLADLAFFTSYFKGIDKQVELSGNFRGRIADLKGRDVFIKLDENTTFMGDFDMNGLPDIDRTFISLDIDEFTTNKIELDRIMLPPFDSLHYVKTPNNFKVLGQITYVGEFVGFINDFVSNGVLRTAIGNVRTDLILKEDKKIGDYRYQGRLGTANFDLGKFYSSGSLGPLSCDLTVEGTSLDLSKMDARFKGDIHNIFIEGYNYTGLKADGTFKQRYFNGDFEIDDPNLIMNFTGFMDFKNQDPILGFDADIQHLNLKELGILPEYDYNSVSGHVKANSVGFEIEKFVGVIELDDVSYCSKDNEYYLSHLTLRSERAGEPKITLESDVARASITGDFDIKDIPASFLEITSRIVPHFKPPLRTHKNQNFALKLEILDFTQISEVFIPKLKVAPNTRLSVLINEVNSYFEMILVSDEISYDSYIVNSLALDARRPDESLYLTIMTDQFKVGKSLEFEDFAIDARTEVDSVYTSVAWGNDNTVHRGDINGKMTVHAYDHLDFLFYRSSMSIKNRSWRFQPGGFASWQQEEFMVNGFELFNNEQFARIDGVISKNPDEIMNVELQEFDLSFLNEFISDIPQLSGRVIGTASVKDVYGQLIFSNDLILRDLKLNRHELGYLCLRSMWDNSIKKLRIDGTLEKDQTNASIITRFTPLAFAGYYDPKNVESPLDVIATVQDLDLAFINEFMSPGILAINGFASGTISLTGKPDAPAMRGKAMLRDASVFVYYLNCKYFVEQQIGITPDMFTFDYIRIRDQEGNPGFLTGQIGHNNFGAWNFDVIIDIDKPMLAMNTTEELNSLYYGKAYTTGTVNIYGYDSNLEFDCNLKTEKGTTLAMPMGSTSEQTFENFVRFVDKNKVKEDKPLDLSGIKLNLAFEITPDAQMQIIFDQSVGDVMKGSGKGNINMVINNLSTFNMYGTVELVKGDYLFTLKNLVNKEFTIKPGGTISWYGDPFVADLNLEALYQVPASLYDLMPDPNYQSGQRVPVDLVMNLTGKMFSPAIGFDINLPTVDNVTRSRVNALISTDQERNRQAFALLVLRRFVSPPNVTAEHSGSNALAAHSSELLSSQVSNWLSQISNEFNLGFNYRPGDDISKEEIALALSTQLFNDRLSVASNLGVARSTSSAATNSSNLIGDIRIEYKITPEGKIRLVVYNESNDFRPGSTAQSPYTQGLGVLYREEFDTFDEFMTGFKGLFKRKKSTGDES